MSGKVVMAVLAISLWSAVFSAIGPNIPSPIVSSGSERAGSYDSSPLPSAAAPGWLLNGSAAPPAICLANQFDCAAGNDRARVDLTVQTPAGGISAWPAVQVLFVLETTPYDGVFEPQNGIYAGAPNDPCSTALNYTGTICDESNGVPFFVANAGSVASAIQLAHPSTRISFGLVDYFATHDGYDDSNDSIHEFLDPVTLKWYNATLGTSGDCCDAGSSSEYHVDIGNFLPASSFGFEVSSTFQRNVLGGGYYLSGSNVSDNLLHSSSITALYGAMSGVGINWSKSTHHVIVWIGSTAPRSPEYVQNYCVADNTWPSFSFDPTTCQSNSSLVLSSGCEPSYAFAPGVVSPDCFGWTRSNAIGGTGSLAALAHDSATCYESLGRQCTVDTIDLFAPSTDPQSLAWVAPHCTYNSSPPYDFCNIPNHPSNNSSTAGSWWVKQNTHRVISAACDLANATGGIWDGPIVANCGPGRAGTLTNVPHGPYDLPNLQNTPLFDAFTNVGFGQPPPGLFLVGEGAGPMFTFVTIGNFALVPGEPVMTSCSSSVGWIIPCDTSPAQLVVAGSSYLAWNWSSDPNLNAMYSGDAWSASFDIWAAGGPFGVLTPIDACTTTDCTSHGSGPVGGVFSEVRGLLAGTGASSDQSFPLVEAMVLTSATSPGGNSVPPPPPPGGQTPPISAPLPIPSPVVIPVVPTVVASSAGVSLTAVAAGLLAAGFARVAIRSRPIGVRMPVGNQIRPRPSLFEQERHDDPKIVRFE